MLKRAVNTISNEPELTGKALDDYAAKQFHEEFANPRHSLMPALAAALRKKGHSDQDIRQDPGRKHAEGDPRGDG